MVTNGGSRWVGLGLVLVAFLTGGFAGVALERTLAAPAEVAVEGVEAPRGGPDRRGSPRGGRGGLPNRAPILDGLELTEDQRSRVDSILEEGRRRVTTLWREQESVFRAAMDSTQAEIHGVLSPEQREEYDARVREFRSRRGTPPRVDSGRGGPTPPPPGR
jgi:Spy/CpxP family protein refolding chaperone